MGSPRRAAVGVETDPAPRPPAARPQPSGSVTHSAAWPGNTNTGARSLPCRVAISTTSSVGEFEPRAVAGAISAALSQVSRVNGRGISSSQALSV